MLLCSRPGKPGFVFCAFYPLFPGERVRVRGSGRTELHIAPGGIDSLRSPCGQSVRFALSLSNWLRQLSNPGRGFSSPLQACNMRKKSPHFHASSSLNMAVRGGLTRYARPAGSLFATLSVCPTGCRQLSNPGRGFSSPLLENIKEKSPYFRTSSHLEYGGEGGIRTPDTLPYTHFPGVLLQPLGHLTILFCCLTAWGATGRYYRELR